MVAVAGGGTVVAARVVRGARALGHDAVAVLVCAHMSVHVAVRGERQVAVAACERPLARVHEDVTVERRCRRHNLRDKREGQMSAANGGNVD